MLFAEKSAAPYAAYGAFQRPVLDQAVEGEITLFTTPSGYLLSDSLAAVLAEYTRPVLWLRLGPEDRDPATFLLSLMAAAQRLHPGIGKATLEKMQREPGPIRGWPPLYARLAREFSEMLPLSSVLVIEQLQNLESTQPNLGLFGNHFLPSLPSSYSIILITSRPLSPAAFPRQTIARGVRDLRIDPRAGSALSRSSETGLSVDCIRRAISLIEGRAVALAGLFTASGALGPAFIQQAVDRSRSIHDLLTSIVRASLALADPVNHQTLALALNLDYSHPALMGAVLGSQAPPSGPWLQPLADGYLRIRKMWQPPLKTALRAVVESNYTPLLHAADYLATGGSGDRAIRLYLQLGDTSSAARNVAGLAGKMMDLGQWQSLKNWLDQLSKEDLQEWPWLVYATGEISAAQGEIEKALQSFSKSASLFSARYENEGACQSLLAESALAAWQGDPERARASALAARATAEAASLRQHQAWSLWQLGCLANNSENFDEAAVYFNKAIEANSDPQLSVLFRKVETLVSQQRDLRRQVELHQQALTQIERAEEEASTQLSKIIDSPSENLSNLLGAHGWSNTPLMLKLSKTASIAEPPSINEQTGLLQGLLNSFSLRLGIAKIPPALREEEPSHPLDLPLPLQSPEDDPQPSSPVPPLTAVTLTELEQPSAVHEARDFVVRNDPLNPIENTREPSYSEIISKGSNLTAHLLGPFRVSLDERPVEKWPGSRGSAVFKYLLLHHDREVPRDVLMDVFWPEAGAESARNSLNVALHGARRAFRSVTQNPVIQFDHGAYHLNPKIQVWIDVDEFERRLQAARRFESAGQVASALNEYEVASSLYQGDFMAEDPYEEWAVLTRERLRVAYLDMLDRLSQIYFSQGQYTACVNLCQLMLERDRCREDAHCRLMRCYSRQGQHHLALRQYQVCLEALRSELNVEPEPATTQLAERIRQRERV